MTMPPPTPNNPLVTPLTRPITPAMRKFMGHLWADQDRKDNKKWSNPPKIVRRRPSLLKPVGGHRASDQRPPLHGSRSAHHGARRSRKVLQVFQQSLVVFDGQQDSDFMSKV
jgi:hypothetical protein